MRVAVQGFAIEDEDPTARQFVRARVSACGASAVSSVLRSSASTARWRLRSDVYRRQLVENSDFRKFDDGLRMTLDCTPALADRSGDLLIAAEQEASRATGCTGRRPR